MNKNKRKVDLASTLNITTTYAGEFAGQYIAASLLEATTLAKDLVTVKPNVQKSEVVKKLAVSNIIANATCDFTPVSDVVLTERKVEPKELQVNLEICKTPFVGDWEALQMGWGVGNRQLPPKFSDFFLAEVAAIVAEATEISLWMGAKGNAGEFDGLITQATADTDVIDVAGAAGGVTAANVIAEIQKVYDKIPQTVFGKEDLYIYVAQNVIRSYQTALSALGYRNDYYVDEKPMNFNGVRLVGINGLDASYMQAAQKSNLWFATALLSDFNEAKLLDMADLDGSQNVRVIMRFQADTNHGIGSEIVLYTPGA